MSLFKYLIVYAALLSAVLIAGCQTPPKPAPTPTHPAPPMKSETSTTAEVKITWHSDWKAALAQARQENKPVLVDFWATWCGPCQLMEETIWPDPQVVAAAQNFIMVKVDVDANQALAQKYEVEGIPNIVFLSPEGKIKHRQVGLLEAAALVNVMKQQQ